MVAAELTLDELTATVDPGLLAQRELPELTRDFMAAALASLNPGSLSVTLTVPPPPALRMEQAREAYEEGSRYADQEDWPGAIQAFQRAVALVPTSEIHSMLGIAYYRSGNLEAAARHFEEAINRRGDNSFAHLLLGTIYMLRRRYEEAIDPLQIAAERIARESHAYFYLGYVYTQLGRLEDAVNAYTLEIENTPRFFEPYRFLAQLQVRLGNQNVAERGRYYLAAIETFRRWTEVEPRDADVFNFIGYLYGEIGNLAAATTAYEAAVNARGDHVVALSNLGTAYLEAERNEDARAVLTRLINLGQQVVREQLANFSKNPEQDVLLYMAEAHQKLGAASLKIYLSQAQAMGEEGADRGRLRQAESDFLTALRYDANNVHSLHNLGIIYYMTSRKEAAVRNFRRVLELAPDTEDADVNLQASLDDLERVRRWLEVQVGLKLSEADQEHPVTTEDLLNTLTQARERVYQEVQASDEDDVFSPERLLQALLPVAEAIEPPDARFIFAATVYEKGWLSSGKAAQLAGIDRVAFLTNLHRAGVAVIDFDEEGVENEIRYAAGE